MSGVRADVERLLRSGLSNGAVASRAGVRKETVARARAELGIVPQPRAVRVGTLEDAYRARTQPVDGGHLAWTGGGGTNGNPVVSFKDRRYSAYRIGFRLHYGRDPQGPVSKNCTVPGCVAGRCMDDTTTRERARIQLAAVLGLDQSATHCTAGHAYAEHGRHTGNGDRYCHACKAASDKTRKGAAA